MKQCGWSGVTLWRSSDRMKAQLLVLIGLCVWCPAAGVRLEKPLLSGPSAALKGSVEAFFCVMPWIPSNMSVVLKLYEERNPNKVIGDHTVNFEEGALFPVVVSDIHDGRLLCEASGNNNTEIESSFSDPLEFKVIYPVKGARIVFHSSGEDLWERQSLILQCNITMGTYVSYDWLKNGAPLHIHVSKLIIHSLSVRHAGDYQCVASNHLNDTTVFNSSSDVITMQVKEYISAPEISLEVMDAAAGNARVSIRCWCRTGSPPITFSLLNNTGIITTETTHTLQALFNVTIELNRDMGWVRCNASNHGNWMLSGTKRLNVESVGGAVTVTLVKNVARDFQVLDVVMHCKVERGTFPEYSWFLNDSRLEGRASFYAVGGTHNSSLSLYAGRHSSGVYRCQASDSFDNTNTVTSTRILINGDAWNRVSTPVLVVVFSCFSLLILAVASCCAYGAVSRRRHARKYALKQEDLHKRISPKQEDEDDDLTLSGYEEDGIYGDRASLHSEEDEMSVDESVLYEGAVAQ